MLQEPKLRSQEPFEGCLQLHQFFFGAVQGNLLGLPAVQGEKAHERGGVDLEPVAANDEPMLLIGSQCHKILNIPQRAESDIEFVHFFIPPALYKIIFIVYNGGRIQTRLDVKYYTTFL